MNALRVEIYEGKSIGNCSNHGISERFDSILLLHEHGPEIIDPDNPPENLCQLVTRIIAGKPYVHIEPVALPNGVGWMAGGCVCWTCDSRFAELSQYPLSLHDRQETVKEYEMYSR